MQRNIAYKLFAYERPSIIGYSISDSFNLYRYEPYIQTRKDHDNFSPVSAKRQLSKYFTNLDLLGPYELFILQRLLDHEFTTNIAVGAKGCGKTATAKYLYGFISNNIKPYFKNTILSFYIDCNDIHPHEHYTYEERFEFVFNEIAQLFKAEIQNHINLLSIIVHQIIRGKEYLSDYYFNELINHIKNRKKKNISNLELENAVNACYNNLNNANKLSYCLSIIGQMWHQSAMSFAYICLDNIDPFDPRLQRDIAFSLASQINKYEFPVFLPMRLISYGQRNVHNLVLDPFGHSGITPLKEATNRVRKITSKEIEQPSYMISSTLRDRAMFWLRTSELYHVFTSHDRFKNLFQAISGRSVQRGLVAMIKMYGHNDYLPYLQKYLTDNEAQEIIYLHDCNADYDNCMRLLYAQALKYYEKAGTRPPREYHYSQLLIVESERVTEMYGPIIRNLFKLNGNINPINFYVLRHAYDSKSQENNCIEIAKLIDELRSAGFKANDICDSINYLHHTDCRLIFNTGLNNYRNFDEFQSFNREEVGVTLSGEFYINNLIKNLDYVAYMLCNNDTDRINVFDYSLAERISFIARIMYDTIENEILNYEKNRQGRGTLEPTQIERYPFLFICILPHLIRECSGILRKHLNNLIARNNIADIEDVYRKIEFLNEKNEHLKRNLVIKEVNIENKMDDIKWPVDEALRAKAKVKGSLN